MSAAVWSTLALFPVFLAVRWPYLRLPLHIDTGFYVSNDTIVRRRWRFGRGWNARFAGASKVIPELFYSLIYLASGGARYARWSRLGYSVVLYAAGIGVGWTAWQLSGNESHYIIALVLFSLGSSEPAYGGYFESGEQLELPFQVVGTYFLAAGLAGGRPWMVGLGLGLWTFESLFVKLSSAVTTAVLSLGVVIAMPGAILPSVAGGLLAGVLWLVWCLANRSLPLRRLQPLVGHEKFSGHRLSIGAYARQVGDKTRLLCAILLARPILGALAFWGAFSAKPGWPIVVYAAALILCYLFQAGRVWYYAIPFQPLLAWLGTMGVVDLLGRRHGTLVLGLALALWMAHHAWESYGALWRGGLDGLSRSAWRAQLFGVWMALKNLALQEAIPALKAQVGTGSLFVFGRLNQAYVLLDTSWETTLVSAADWLDPMQPRWWVELNERLVSEPPDFLLDTDSCLDEAELLASLGLAYELVLQCPPSFRLLRFSGRRSAVRNLDVKLYRPRGG